MKKLTLVFLSIFILFGATACTEEEMAKQQEKVQKENAEKYKIIEEAKIVEEGNEYFKMRYIVGTLQNTSKKKTNLIMLTFNLYDKDGNVIGSAMATINHIEKDGTWKFKAMITEDDFETFKLESITGF